MALADLPASTWRVGLSGPEGPGAWGRSFTLVGVARGVHPVGCRSGWQGMGASRPRGFFLWHSQLETAEGLRILALIGGSERGMAHVRSQNSAVGRLLGAAAGAIYAVNEHRKVVFCNAAFCDLLGIGGGELLGRRCDYCTAGADVTPAGIAASLCPPPEVLAGQPLSTEMELLHASGRLISCSVAFQPLGASGSSRAGVLAFIGDWGRADRRQSEYQELHNRLWTVRRNVLADCELDELVGTSPAIRRVRDQIELASHGRGRVVVCGPSGSGREHVARLLHRRVSPDPFRQPVPLCCPLLDAELLQATITSLMRQAGAGDVTGQPPVPGVRGTPTLLLLEIDELGEQAQSELAGFLALPDFELYSIATSKEPVMDLAVRGRFRTDLACALSTLTINLPPLAQRPEDISLLSQYFLEAFNARGDRQLSGFSSEALDELAGYGWPDNVDELSEFVELACQRAAGPVVETRDLPDQIHWAATADAHPPQTDHPIDLDKFLAGIEKELISRALRRCKGNKTQAARLLGLNRARFHRRLEYFGIS